MVYNPSLFFISITHKYTMYNSSVFIVTINHKYMMYNPGLSSMSITHQCTIKSEYFPLPPECPTGSYGDECKESCSGHCAGQYKQACNNVDGSCDRGCQPGYQGKTCHQGRWSRFSIVRHEAWSVCDLDSLKPYDSNVLKIEIL